MLQLAPPPATTPTFDPAGVAAHGIGRGEFAALIFSGSRAALGDVAGFYTWSTPRKFVLPDPRLERDADFAHIAASPLQQWPAGRFAPTPGVCFVFDDHGHPGIEEMRSQGGIEFEHFVVLSRLTQEKLFERRLESFVSEVARGSCPPPIALLGFGDQGRRIAVALRERRGAGPDLVVDSDEARRTLAAAAGLRTVDFTDPEVTRAALISSPLSCPPAFSRLIARARAVQGGRPVLDNSLPWHGGGEFVVRGSLRLTTGVDRACSTDGWRIAARAHGLDIALAVVRDEQRRLGSAVIRHLSSAARVQLGDAVRSHDLARPTTPTSEFAATKYQSTTRVFAGLAGQSNQHDAALSVFAAREFLSELLPAAVATVMPAEHRAALGQSPFERALFGTTTNRSLGAPYMSACEQTALGVLAAAFAADSPIVEIGSALGGSTLLMAAATAASRPEIYSIDPDAPTRHLMRAMFEAEGHADRLRQVVKTSDAALADLRHLIGRAGLVFVDGLHLESVAAADFAGYAPLVRPGGCIAFHDVSTRYAGVFRVVAERVATDRRFRPLFMADTLAAFERV